MYYIWCLVKPGGRCRRGGGRLLGLIHAVDRVWTRPILSWADYLYWQKTDKRMIRCINELIKATQREPFEGIGKPEPLKHQLQGAWSRRIDGEHRLVYEVADDQLRIIACRFHY